MPAAWVLQPPAEIFCHWIAAWTWLPLGEPWRAGKRPHGKNTLPAAAACLKRFYLHRAGLGINRELGGQPARTRLAARADRDRAMPGICAGNRQRTAGATPGPAPAPEDAARQRP